MLMEPGASKSISDNASDFREKAGTICRQLAFAGIAVVWLFKLGNDAAAAIPTDLVVPLALLVVSLALDLFENAVGVLIWGIRPSRILRAATERPWWFRWLFATDETGTG